METIGWLSTAMLALCGIPQAIKSLREGHSRGLSHGLVLLWWGGEVFGTIYVWPLGFGPLLLNYGFNLIITSIILKYKYWERERK